MINILANTNCLQHDCESVICRLSVSVWVDSAVPVPVYTLLYTCRGSTQVVCGVITHPCTCSLPTVHGSEQSSCFHERKCAGIGPVHQKALLGS